MVLSQKLGRLMMSIKGKEIKKSVSWWTYWYLGWVKEHNKCPSLVNIHHVRKAFGGIVGGMP